LILTVTQPLNVDERAERQGAMCSNARREKADARLWHCGIVSPLCCFQLPTRIAEVKRSREEGPLATSAF
jgi:hypothetical protein